MEDFTILFVAVAFTIAATCMACSWIETSFHRSARLRREREFAVALGNELAPTIRDAIEARARQIASAEIDRLAALVPARASNGKFAKRHA